MLLRCRSSARSLRRHHANDGGLQEMAVNHAKDDGHGNRAPLWISGEARPASVSGRLRGYWKTASLANALLASAGAERRAHVGARVFQADEQTMSDVGGEADLTLTLSDV